MRERLGALTLLDWLAVGAWFGAWFAVLDWLAARAVAAMLVREAEEALRE